MQGYYHSQQDIEKMRKYPLDDTAFDNLSADAKYWIGYIMARGSVKRSSGVPNSPSLKISILKKDRNHLDTFKEFIDSKLSVYEAKNRGVCEFEFSSRRIVSELERYGIRPKMRYHEKVILLENDKDFWRGFVDGNAIFDIKPSLRIKRGRELILQFKIFAEKILGCSIGVSIPEGKMGDWSLTITGINAAELYKKLLYDKNGIALDRNMEWLKQALSLSVKA